MPDLAPLISHWGYLAIFVVVILGNMGLPIPEETILALAGYLVWQKKLRLVIVLVVGSVSAVAGDNAGYWIGRRYGQAAIERYGQWILMTPERLEGTRHFMMRYGPLGVFAARFIAGLRFLAGPLAGATGLRPLSFIVANALGAIVYIPVVVGAGYAVGYGLGDYVKQIERIVGRVEHVVLVAAIGGAAALMGWRALRAARARRSD